jgi:hypothetical protein
MSNTQEENRNDVSFVPDTNQRILTAWMDLDAESTIRQGNEGINLWLKTQDRKSIGVSVAPDYKDGEDRLCLDTAVSSAITHDFTTRPYDAINMTTLRQKLCGDELTSVPNFIRLLSTLEQLLFTIPEYGQDRVFVQTCGDGESLNYEDYCRSTPHLSGHFEWFTEKDILGGLIAVGTGTGRLFKFFGTSWTRYFTSLCVFGRDDGHGKPTFCELSNGMITTSLEGLRIMLLEGDGVSVYGNRMYGLRLRGDMQPLCRSLHNHPYEEGGVINRNVLVPTHIVKADEADVIHASKDALFPTEADVQPTHGVSYRDVQVMKLDVGSWQADVFEVSPTTMNLETTEYIDKLLSLSVQAASVPSQPVAMRFPNGEELSIRLHMPFPNDDGIVVFPIFPRNGPGHKPYFKDYLCERCAERGVISRPRKGDACNFKHSIPGQVFSDILCGCPRKITMERWSDVSMEVDGEIFELSMYGNTNTGSSTRPIDMMTVCHNGATNMMPIIYDGLYSQAMNNYLLKHDGHRAMPMESNIFDSYIRTVIGVIRHYQKYHPGIPYDTPIPIRMVGEGYHNEVRMIAPLTVVRGVIMVSRMVWFSVLWGKEILLEVSADAPCCIPLDQSGVHEVHQSPELGIQCAPESVSKEQPSYEVSLCRCGNAKKLAAEECKSCQGDVLCRHPDCVQRISVEGEEYNYVKRPLRTDKYHRHCYECQKVFESEDVSACREWCHRCNARLHLN